MKYVSRGKDETQVHSRIDKGEGEWSKFIGLELKRQELYGASESQINSVFICEDNWKYRVESCMRHKTGT